MQISYTNVTLNFLQRTSETNLQSKSDENGFYNIDLNDQNRL